MDPEFLGGHRLEAYLECFFILMANEVGFAGLRTPDMDPDCESKKAID
jgi:hypothetical protein